MPIRSTEEDVFNGKSMLIQDHSKFTVKCRSLPISRWIITIPLLLNLLTGCSRDHKKPESDPYSDNGSQNTYSDARAENKVQALKTGETWPILNESDVFVSGQNNLNLYRTQKTVTKLCEIHLNNQFLIVEKSEERLKIRLDRIAHKDLECPKEFTFAYIKTSEIAATPAHLQNTIDLTQTVPVYSEDESIEEAICVLPEGASIQVIERTDITSTKIVLSEDLCGDEVEEIGIIKNTELLPLNELFYRTPKLYPHIITFDLNIFPSQELVNDLVSPACTIAKGNSILVNTENNSLQVPINPYCDEELSLAYFQYRSGLWWKDQPK